MIGGHAMSTFVDLLQPLLAGGIQRNHFFNGRLLSAEDLRAEQDASRAQARGLARALGAGVAQGLEVAIASRSPRPSLRITAGIGFNALGDPVRLGEPCELRLVPPATTATIAGGLFAACEQPLTQPSLLSASIWVLAARPVSGLEGRAPMADQQAIAVGRGHCGARWTTEGLAFRLVPVDLEQPHTLIPRALDATGARQAALRATLAALMDATAPEATEQLRSLLAHVALGLDMLPPGARAWGVADALRDKGLMSDCDLPLALVVLGSGGLRIVDGWAVRRPCAGPGAMTELTALGAAGRRRQEGEAAWQQFQAQLAGLAPVSGAAATRWLHALPAAGWLPPAWNWRSFLGPHAPPQETPVDPAWLRPRIVAGFDQDAIVLGRTPLAALRVLRAAGVDGVVFARAEGAELRVTLAAASPGELTLSVHVQPATGPTFTALRFGAGSVALDGLPPGDGARLRVRAEGFEPLDTALPRLVGGQVLAAPAQTLVALAGGTIEVQAIGADSERSLGDQVVSVRALQGSTTREARYAAGRDRWILRDMPPGVWQLVGDAPGYQGARRDGVGPVAPGQTLSTTLAFEPAVTGLARPDPCVSQGRALGVKGTLSKLSGVRLCLVLAGTVFDVGYHAERQPSVKAGRLDPDVRFGVERRRKTGNTKAARLGFGVGRGDGALTTTKGGPWTGFIAAGEAPTAITDWMHDWRNWFAAAFDDLALAKTEPRLLVAPDYERPAKLEGAARGFRETPPAWVDFGPFAVPVALKFDDGRTKAPVPLETGAKFLDRATATALRDAGIDHVDDLAWAWTDLLVDATGLPETDLWLAMQEAQQAVARINDERSWIDGLSKEDNERLKQAGYDDDVKLARATESELTAVIGSAYQARIIKRQAEKAVVKPRVRKGTKPGGGFK
jgi:hypothetical protein